MNANLYPALVAILASVPVGIALFTPFVAIQYRRRGRLTARQLFQWGALLLYGIALWAYTLLPLPTPGSYECLPPQVVPFRFVSDILSFPHDSPGALLRNPAVAQVALNVALFVPVGVFFRLLWRRGIVVSAVTGVLVSLAIELTQVTGLWGVYACAFRLFDVDDLLANTAGALLGSILSLVLRQRKHAAETATDAPVPVTLLRRIVGIVCDVTALFVLRALTGVVIIVVWRVVEPSDASPVLVVLLAVVPTVLPVTLAAVLVLTTGRTIGDHATLIRWDGGPRAVLVSRGLRFLFSAGPWVLVASYGPDIAFPLAVGVLILLVVRRDRSGLLGLLAGMHPVDARPALAKDRKGASVDDVHAP